MASTESSSNWGAAAQASAPVIAALIGEALARGDEDEAEALYERAVQEFGAINVPSLEEMRQQAASFDPTRVDPQARQAQRRVMEKFLAEADRQGLSDDDKMALEEARKQTAQAEQAQRQAILENARARGVSGSGLELQSQLMAQQGAADRLSSGGNQMAIDARRRAMQALAQAGDLSGQMRGQSFQEQAEQGRAQDAVNRFNAENVQQRFDNRMRLAGAKSGMDIFSGDRRQGRADRTRRRAAGVGQAASQGINAYQNRGK